MIVGLSVQPVWKSLWTCSPLVGMGSTIFAGLDWTLDSGLDSVCS